MRMNWRAWAPSSDFGEPSIGTPVRVPLVTGTIGLLLVYLSLAALYTAGSPLFFRADESSNVGYAISLYSGTLPTFETPIPTHDFPRLAQRLQHDVDIGHDHRVTIWTANHPPLFYTLVGAPLRTGLDSGYPIVGLWVAKGMNVLAGGGVIIATVALARAMAPTRPQVALVAGAWITMIPLLISEPAGLYNDFVAALSATGALAAGAALATKGRTWPRLFAAAAWGSVAALTRVSGLLFVAVACALAALAVFKIPHLSIFERIQRLITGTGIIVVAVTTSSAWFYWRNISLYGDISGATVARNRLGMESHQSVWEVLLSSDFWSAQIGQIFLSRLLGAIDRASPLGAEITVSAFALSIMAILWLLLITVLIVPPFVLAIPAVLRHVRKRTTYRVTSTGVAILLMMSCIPVVIVTTAFHASHGGNPHGRYLLQALPLIAVAIAAGWTRITRTIPAHSVIVPLGVALGINISSFLLFTHVRHAPGHFRSFGDFAPIKALMEAPAGPVIVPSAAALLIIGLPLYVRALRVSAAAPCDQPCTSTPEPRACERHR